MAKTKKRIIWIIIIIAVIAGGYYLLRPKPPVTTYTTADVTRGNLAQTVSETGTIKTVNQTDLSFKISGRVTNLYADVGDKITTGELLARLDMGTLGAQLAQAQQEVKVQQETLDNLVHHKTSQPSTGDQRDAQRARLKQAKDGVDSAPVPDTRHFYVFSDQRRDSQT